MSVRRSSKGRIGSKCRVEKAELVGTNNVLNMSMIPAAAPQWASRQNVSGDHRNEDRPFCGQGAVWTEAGEELAFCIAGVADGHGGSTASDLVAKSCAELLSMAMSSEVGNVKVAVEDTFQRLEGDCLALPDQAGTCVCLCLIGAGQVWCANLGDCRAVLYGLDGEATCLLSVDQRAAQGAEYERIVRAGGALVDNTVVGLTPSRSLGDADVKARCPQNVILAYPELRTCQGEGLIVLGSDGLWDTLAVQDVQSLLPPVGKARRRATQDTDVLHAIAEHLVKRAVDRGSEDDVTAVVLPLLQQPSNL